MDDFSDAPHSGSPADSYPFDDASPDQEEAEPSNAQHAPPPLTIQTDQRQDVLLRRTLSDTITTRLLAVRCREAQEQNLSGQDFALLKHNQTEYGVTSLCFCVCDGVGSSYRGDFAARYLARHMLAWLQRLPYIPKTPESFQESVRASLGDWAERGQRRLSEEAEAASAPPGTSALVREALAELRETYGAEAVFLAGRLDVTHAGAPLASNTPARLLLCWMGNVVAQIFPTGEAPFAAGSASDDSARWSTGRGVRGTIETRILSLAGLHRLIVYTDGVGPLADRLAILDDDALYDAAAQLLTEPASDDMTLLDVELR